MPARGRVKARDAIEAVRDALVARTDELAVAQADADVCQQILAHCPDGILLVDREGTILRATPEAERMLGYPPNSLRGRNVDALVPPKFAAVHVEHRHEYFANPRTRPMGEGLSLHALRGDGRELPVDISLASFTFAGEPVAMCVVRDVSERRKLQESLRVTEERFHQSQKMEAIGQLAAGVAHDFNNLLSVILGYSAMLIADLRPDDPLRADLVEIEAAGTRAAELTRQLLAFARRQVLQLRPCDLNAIVAGIERMLRRLIGENIELHVATRANLPMINADPQQIEQVIVNLVVNARDAMPSGGKLTIETTLVELDEDYAAMHLDVTPGPHVVLAVSDTGTGMSAETRAHLFEPFFTTKEKGKGTGLGLATVFGIVKQSDGNVWVYSEPGVGTTFKCYFPARASTGLAASAISPNPERVLRGHETILLVEDEEAVRSIAAAILRRFGYRVLVALNGGDALLVCEQHRGAIDLLLTDVVMPRMSGPDLADRLRVVRPSMKVLFMSGYADRAAVRHGFFDERVAFLQKPLTPEALARKVREVLDAPDRGAGAG